MWLLARRESKDAHLAEINYDPLVAHSAIHKHSLFVSGASLKIIIPYIIIHQNINLLESSCMIRKRGVRIFQAHLVHHI